MPIVVWFLRIFVFKLTENAFINRAVEECMNINGKTLIVDIPVRFKDIDQMGHVNNSVFLTYFEEARIVFITDVLGIDSPEGYNFILAQASCDYIKPIQLQSQVQIHIWISGIGRKSFKFKYIIIDKGNITVEYAKGETVQVFYDYKTGVSVPIPASFREKVSAYTMEG